MRPNPLSIHSLHRLAAALALGIAVLALAPGVPAQARTRAHSSVCRYSRTVRHGSHHRGCLTAAHRSKAPRHAKKHPHATRRRAKPAPGVSSSGAIPPPKDVTAMCEDGSEPLRVGSETFECEDGSDPRCEAGFTLALSNDDSTLLCSAVLPTATGEEDESCEGGPASCPAEAPGSDCSEAAEASAGEAAARSCEEAVEPGCEAGTSPAGSGLEAPPLCASPGEEGDESPASAGQAPAVPSAQAARAS